MSVDVIVCPELGLVRQLGSGRKPGTGARSSRKGEDAPRDRRVHSRTILGYAVSSNPVILDISRYRQVMSMTNMISHP